ncbi:hypothetical protein JTE90_019275 [Oedothorax gibbosus]|uniref:Uncharacterized protein n=1 Tax=Oedothorax gibbosus TaxID=931172 RepID=A0AAV6UX33_9ARAC|nr:hypothetical protein JTE90_019275 [Oedothorax gibbosus]
MNIKQAFLCTLLGIVSSGPFLGLIQQAADEAQLMMRDEGLLGQTINSGLKVLNGEYYKKLWQNELKRMLVSALRQSRGENRRTMLKALATFARLQKRNASPGEIVASIRQILGDVWKTKVVKDSIGSNVNPSVDFLNHSSDIIRSHREEVLSSTAGSVSV